MMKKYILLVLVGCSALLHGIEREHFLRNCVQDFAQGDDFNEICDLIRDDRALLLPGNGTSFLEILIESHRLVVEQIAALPKEPDVQNNQENQERRAVLREEKTGLTNRKSALQDLFNDALKLGKNNEQFENQLERRRDQLIAQGRASVGLLNKLYRVFPRIVLNNEPVGEQEPAEDVFVWVEPTAREKEWAKEYQDFVLKAIDSSDPWEYIPAVLDKSIYQLCDPSSNQPLMVLLAKRWLKARKKHDNTMRYVRQRPVKANRLKEIFADMLDMANQDDNQRLRSQLVPLMRLFKQNESDYAEHADSYRYGPHTGGLIGTLENTFPGLFDQYKADALPDRFDAVAIPEEQQKQERSALYAAQLFSAVHRTKNLDQAHVLLRDHPPLIEATNEVGESLLYSCIHAYDTYPLDKRPDLKGLIAHLLLLDASLDRATDYVNPNRFRLYNNENGIFPSVEDYLARLRPDPRRGQLLPEATHEALQPVLETYRAHPAQLVQDCYWIKEYVPRARYEDASANQNNAQSDDDQRVLDQEPQGPTFFERNKSTLKHFAGGVLCGMAAYYGYRRYKATPQELYAPPHAVVT